MTTWGMKFSQTGKSVDDDRNVIYTSEKDQFNVDINANPPHLGVIDPIANFTNLTTTTTSPLATETLLQVEHHLPFIPSVSAYMHVQSSPSDYAFLIGRYVVDFLRLGGTLVYADADEKYFYLRHDKYHNFNMGTPTTQPETDMDKWKIKVKWLIGNARFVGMVERKTPT